MEALKSILRSELVRMREVKYKHECMRLSSFKPAPLCSHGGGLVSVLSNRPRAKLMPKSAANTTQVHAVNPPSQHEL